MARTKMLAPLKGRARELGVDESVLDEFTKIGDVPALRKLVAKLEANAVEGVAPSAPSARQTSGVFSGDSDSDSDSGSDSGSSGAPEAAPEEAAAEAAAEAAPKEAAPKEAGGLKRAAPDDQASSSSSSSAAAAKAADDVRKNKNKKRKTAPAPRYYLEAFGGSKKINTFMLATDSDTGQSKCCATKILHSDDGSYVVELLLVWEDEPRRMVYQCGVYELQQIQAMLYPRVNTLFGTLVIEYAKKLKRAVERHFGEWLRVEVCVV
jgi:hypothetical protein